ncbi:MAG: PhnA domain protein [Bdellovibrionales bacterium]|mgnify:CR=1 FL=1|jgi:protein PhnA|nr:PhnA domain protein [Bdellovibrionales bacterium]
MSIEVEIDKRSNSQCELCSSTSGLTIHELIPNSSSIEKSLMICEKCQEQISNPEAIKDKDWDYLNDTMWSECIPVQVMSWKILKQLNSRPWAQNLLDQMYLPEEVQEWASSDTGNTASCFDSNGSQLFNGDTVTIIKDLVVKGANFTAKRGAVVKNITLTENHEQIEGRVNGTRIVLISKFLKKSNNS